MAYALFWMRGGRRRDLISSHNFYTEQAKKRLLSQFEDIDGEVDAYGEAKLKEYSTHYSSEADNGSALQEAAHDEKCNHHQMLNEMREITLFSVVSGIFHEWEKQLRKWTAHEIQRVHSSKDVKSPIEKATIHELLGIFESLGWSIYSKQYFASLNRCRLVVNAYKHGEGDSMRELRRDHSDLFKNKSLEINAIHLDEFSKAIISFWEDVPEYIRDNENKEIG